MFNKKVLITGGAGFIGSHIATDLIKKGSNVIVVDNEFSGKKKNLEEAKILSMEPGFGNLDYVKLDLRNEYLKDLILETKPEIVFHQAAITSVPRSIKDPEMTLSNNITGTLKLLLACKDAGVKRVLFASSSSVYGNEPTLPKQEEKTGDPLSPYALSKQTCEHLLKQFYYLHGLETVSLRYFNVFGPKQDPNSPYSAAIPLFIKKIIQNESPTIFGDGTQSRDFTFIQNVIDGNLLFAQAPKEQVCGKVFNLAYGGSISVNSLVEKINQLLGTSIKPIYAPERPGEIKDSCADITKAKSIGFTPPIGFEDGLKHTIEYYKKIF